MHVPLRSAGGRRPAAAGRDARCTHAMQVQGPVLEGSAHRWARVHGCVSLYARLLLGAAWHRLLRPSAGSCMAPLMAAPALLQRAALQARAEALVPGMHAHMHAAHAHARTAHARTHIHAHARTRTHTLHTYTHAAHNTRPVRALRRRACQPVRRSCVHRHGGRHPVLLTHGATQAPCCKALLLACSTTVRQLPAGSGHLGGPG